jgi:ferrous iron transport protein B
MEIALIGNPNTGKTSLFNNLTGSYEYVGNWSGVTVEKKVGVFKNHIGKLIDLPGIYSLNPLSKDEGVVTTYFLEEQADRLLNILDASQLERNLHLTLQLLEYEKPAFIGLNMIDVANNRGIKIDTDKLSQILGVPVVPIVARSGKGCDTLIEVISTSSEHSKVKKHVYYGKAIEDAITQLSIELIGKTEHSPRWLAIQLFEGNEYVYHYLSDLLEPSKIVSLVSNLETDIKKENSHLNSLANYIYLKRKEVIEKIL